MRLLILTFLALILNAEITSCQKTIHVPTDYGTIQEALVGSDMYDTILVAPGTYFENLKWPDGKDLHVISSEGEENTIVDADNDGRVIEMINLTEASLLKGFTIQNGYFYRGAGMYAEQCGIELKNLIIQKNNIEGNSTYGAGALLEYHYGNIISCQIINNTISKNTNWFVGVGMRLGMLESIEIRDCLFSNNHGISDVGEVSGGGLYAESYGNPAGLRKLLILRNCHFNNNTLDGNITDGAALYMGGIFSDCEARIYDSVFENNESRGSEKSHGGVMSLTYGADFFIANSEFRNNKANKGSCFYRATNQSENHIVSACILSDNKSYSNIDNSSVIFTEKEMDLTIVNSEISHNQGNALISQPSNATNNISIINSTIAYNEKPISLANSNLSISESILWDNGSAEIENYNPNDHSTIITNSIIKGGHEGTNVIDSDPLFKSRDELIPENNSPCINAGDASLNVSTDILGVSRPMPIGTNPDLGAYEVNQSIQSSTSDHSAKKYKLFPNPTQDWIFFSETINTVKIISNEGKLLYKYHLVNSINVEEFSAGNYTIVLYNDGAQQIESLVIMR